MRVYTLNFSSTWRNRLEGIYTLTVCRNPLYIYIYNVYVYFICRIHQNTPVVLLTCILGRRWSDVYLTTVLLYRFEFSTSWTNLFYTINFLDRHVCQTIVKLIWSNALFQLLYSLILTGNHLVACLKWLTDMTNSSVSSTDTIHREISLKLIYLKKFGILC